MFKTKCMGHIIPGRGRRPGVRAIAGLELKPGEEFEDTAGISSGRLAKLRVLEEKGHVRHEEQSLRYVYLPIVPRDKAMQSALRHLVATFFDNSTEQAIAALLNLKDGGLAPDKLERLSALIEKAKQEGI